MARTLVVFFSRTGTTKKVATEVAKALGADTEEIVDRTNRFGVRGYLRSGREAFLHHIPDVEPPLHNASSYDLVIVGTPIWNVSLSSPVRAYLRRNRNLFGKVAFFCTCGGMGGERVLGQMAGESKREPEATLVLNEQQFSGGDYRPMIDEFTKALARAVPAVEMPAAPHTGAARSSPFARV